MKQLSKNQIKKGAEEVSEALRNFFGSGNRYGKKLSLIIFLFLFNINISTPGAQGEAGTSMAVTSQPTKEELYTRSVKDKIKTSLIVEVDRYIQREAPGSKLDSELLIDKCVEYDTDIIFVLAQGLLESHFGTKGIATKTNSVWNVGAYDNQTPRNWYNHPDESLEPYLKLVNEKYFINVTTEGDTIYKNIYQMTKDRGYINYKGKRFASAKGYENGMRKLMIKINAETSINFYQEILILPNEKLLAYFGPPDIGLTPEAFMALN